VWVASKPIFGPVSGKFLWPFVIFRDHNLSKVSIEEHSFCPHTFYVIIT
ncbi:unnamed protein product, partial [Arabidopsis halleri]